MPLLICGAEPIWSPGAPSTNAPSTGLREKRQASLPPNSVQAGLRSRCGAIDPKSTTDLRPESVVKTIGPRRGRRSPRSARRKDGRTAGQSADRVECRGRSPGWRRKDSRRSLVPNSPPIAASRPPDRRRRQPAHITIRSSLPTCSAKGCPTPTNGRLGPQFAGSKRSELVTIGLAVSAPMYHCSPYSEYV
jgi:hypothetical protein